MPECAVCGGGDFDLSDGLFFCAECGTQSQDAREELTEDTSILFNRTLTAKKERGLAAESDDDANLSPLEKFQVVLQKQSDALISLGFDPTVKEAVKLIWFLYLKHYGYAFNEDRADNNGGEKGACTPSCSSGGDCDPDSGVRTPRKKRAKVGPNPFDVFPEDAHLFCDDSDSDSDKDDGKLSGAVLQSGRELYMQRRSKGMCRKPTPVYFTLKHTIGLCYLALLYAEQNVMLSDFSRWIKMNKVPYHNLPSILPRSMMLGKDGLSFVAVFPMAADHIYMCVRHLYFNLPLPPLPPPSAEFVCHTLIDRLKLPACLHGLVDRVLAAIHAPKFLSGPMAKGHNYWRFDGECLAVIIMQLRLLYKLDDKFELMQTSTTTDCSSDRDEATPGAMVYVWTDWVQLYCRHLQDSIEDAVPVTESEFARVKDWQAYLDFCRVEVFTNTRLTPIDKTRRYHYNRELYTNISGIFRQYLSKSRQRDQEENPTSSSSSLRNKRQVESTFTPRLVPLDSLLTGPTAPCREYDLLPTSTKRVHLTDIQLSRSMQFLLQVGSELIDITVEELYSSLLMVEAYFQKRTLVPFQRAFEL